MHADDRGVLIALALDRHGFAAVRRFIVEAPDGAIRGGHAHHRGRQLFVRLTGSIDIELRYGGGVERPTLDDELRAILVEPPVWASQTYRGEHASGCLSLLLARRGSEVTVFDKESEPAPAAGTKESCIWGTCAGQTGTVADFSGSKAPAESKTSPAAPAPRMP